MSAEFRAHLAFHLAGARTDGAADAVDRRELRPAILAQHRDLPALRYDFPLVLVADGDPTRCVRSLSELMDELLRAIAPRGSAGERTRHLVLRLERDVRAAVAAGAQATLSELWTAAASRITTADPTAAAELARARAALAVDGTVVDCDAGVALRMITHVWRAVQQAKVRRLHALTGRLTMKLADILHAQHLASPAGRSVEQLAAGFGTAHGDVFDFAAMSRVLTRTAIGPMPVARARRIREALAVLEAEDLFPTGNGRKDDSLDNYVFDGCAPALAAHHARLPVMRKVARAIAVAELEVEGLYVEERHDALLARMFERDLRPGDRALFPDFLIRLDLAHAPAGEGARLLELLSAGLPVKVVVEAADLFERSDELGARTANGLGLRPERLAAIAMALGQVHVVQAPAASLLAVRDRILDGIGAAGPSVVSVFSGASRHAAGLPPYLVSAAALQSRAFPVFSFDPAAGPDWASRCSVVGNPQPERAWPVQSLSYADGEQQRATIEVAFTFADFAACDRRYADHLAGVAGSGGGDALAPAAEVIAGGAKDDRVPYLLMVDGGDRLERVIIDERLVELARQCADGWRSLQELGGIHNSHALRLLAREQLAWAERDRALASAPAVATPAGAAIATLAATATTVTSPAPPTNGASAAATPAAAAPNPDVAYIETTRCTTCNECTRLNDRMFGYDGNKQAYVANPDAGTFAQLVQAAENCQLSIIHPGKPRNPKEPGLPELVERAQLYQ